ncbi:hypothetical protein [Limoniibacter endophyticus]|uniref:Uncharacterized protein n=1 Tax=Limoniibacter endophyticus TaxID=1565040 RepID=A0A8J3DDU0_9HYPH|nr:hypothetical protein [Limoniibacter endophyticus]GHC61271.1 hypothetical protein GCM10010136_01730 [Limoniibacter endophyticus]
MADAKFQDAFAASGLPSQFKRAFAVGVRAYVEAMQAGDSEVTKHVENAMRAKRRELIAIPLERAWSELARAAIEAMQAGESEAVNDTLAAEAELSIVRKERDALQAENERMREALKPFAKAAENWLPMEQSDIDAPARLEHPNYGLERHGEFTFGDLFNARAVLAEQEGGA